MHPVQPGSSTMECSSTSQISDEEVLCTKFAWSRCFTCAHIVYWRKELCTGAYTACDGGRLRLQIWPLKCKGLDSDLLGRFQIVGGRSNVHETVDIDCLACRAHQTAPLMSRLQGLRGGAFVSLFHNPLSTHEIWLKQEVH